MTGVQLIMECLKAHHVTTLFGYPGGAIMPTYDALYDAGFGTMGFGLPAAVGAKKHARKMKSFWLRVMAHS